MLADVIGAELCPCSSPPRRIGRCCSFASLPAVTAGASGLFQSAPAIPTLTAAPRALPAIPRPSADGSPVERPRRFLNTLGQGLPRHGHRPLVVICLRDPCRQMSSAN